MESLSAKGTNGSDKRHYKKGIFSSKDFKRESPSKQVKSNAFNLSKLIKSDLFHDTFKVWVEGMVVFSSPSVKLEIKEPTVTILRGNELLDYISNYRPKSNLTEQELRSIGNFIVNYNY